jgi:Tol biopolymer transport system component
MPDGKHLVYSSINPGLVFGSEVSIVSIDGVEPAHPLPDLGRNAAVLAVSRTGSIAYSRVVMESNIWRQEIARPGGSVRPPVRLLASSAMDANAQYSPDGKRIAFASNRSGHSEIWTCGSDGANCMQVTDFKASSVTGTPRWFPDGKDLVFDSAAAGNPAVYIVQASGGVTRRVTDSRLKGVVPSWSHDGNWIYFSSPVTGRSEIWKISPAGDNAVQVTRDGGFVAFDSLDSRTLYYTKTERKAKLFRSSIDGSAETELFSGVSNRGLSVAADRIYYLREEADGSTCIRQFLFAAGEDTQVALLREQPSLGLSLSPDGRYLIYSQLRTASNLMLAEPK